jgi:hypothetical protein
VPDQLFAALAAGDLEEFETVCRQNSTAIIEAFPQWQHVPDCVRDNPEAAQRHVDVIIEIATFFADDLGNRDLLNQLIGPDETNPFVRWRASLAKADALFGESRFLEELELLQHTISDVESCKGNAVNTYHPFCVGGWGRAVSTSARSILPKMRRNKRLPFVYKRTTLKGSNVRIEPV